MSLEPDGNSRVRILGRKATNKEVAKYVASAMSNPNQTKSKLATALGTSRPTIDKYLALAATMQMDIQASNEKKASKMEETQPEFLANPYIQVWKEFMDNKARGGKPFAESAKSNFLLSMYQVCKTLRCPPQYFILGDTQADILEHGRKLMQEFMRRYTAGTALVKYGKKAGQADPQQAAYRFSKVVRDFMRSHGHQYPNGEGGVMSQSVAAFHGNYSDIRIPEATHQKIKDELRAEFGSDSDEWLAYTFGLETFARQGAIFGAPTQHEELTQDGKTILILKVYESKTSNYKRGLWSKHIFDPELQGVIRRRAEKSGKLFETTPERQSEIAQTLKRKYKEHGLTAQGQKEIGNAETSYFLRKPYHVLRHAGAQRLLRATKWNVAYVAARGWKTTQELIDSYGEMPAEMEAEIWGKVAF